MLIALIILDSQNLGANPAAKPQETTSILITFPIMFAQMSAIIDLTMEEPHGVKPYDHSNQDKWATLEERLKVVEVFDFYDPVRAVEICLVPKKFRVPKFIKYTGLKCPFIFSKKVWSVLR
jgi:hypothetical protein